MSKLFNLLETYCLQLQVGINIDYLLLFQGLKEIRNMEIPRLAPTILYVFGLSPPLLHVYRKGILYSRPNSGPNTFKLLGDIQDG